MAPGPWVALQPQSPNLSFFLPLDQSDTFQSVSYSQMPPPSAGEGPLLGTRAKQEEVPQELK